MNIVYLINTGTFWIRSDNVWVNVLCSSVLVVNFESDFEKFLGFLSNLQFIHRGMWGWHSTHFAVIEKLGSQQN